MFHLLLAPHIHYSELITPYIYTREREGRGEEGGFMQTLPYVVNSNVVILSTLSSSVWFFFLLRDNSPIQYN